MQERKNENVTRIVIKADKDNFTMPVIGNCSKHPGQNFVNCPLCEVEKMKELYASWQVSPFYHMGHFPDKEPGEDFSKTVIIFSEDTEDGYFDIGYYDFENSDWVIFGDMSFRMICWCYAPNPVEFLKGKNLKSAEHRGYY